MNTVGSTLQIWYVEDERENLSFDFKEALFLKQMGFARIDHIEQTQKTC
jgi:hypothetical protein